MPIRTPEEFERSMGKIASLVLSEDSLPAQIINSDQQNQSNDWDEEGDKQRSEATIDAFLDNLEEGVRALAKT